MLSLSSFTNIPTQLSGVYNYSAVAAWLAHEGYSRAFNAFNKFISEQKTTETEKLESLEKRKSELSESMESRRGKCLVSYLISGNIGLQDELIFSF